MKCSRKPGKFAIISLNDTGFVSSSKPTFLHSKFVGWDIIKYLKWYGMKWNCSGLKLLTVTLRISGKSKG